MYHSLVAVETLVNLPIHNHWCFKYLASTGGEAASTGWLLGSQAVGQPLRAKWEGLLSLLTYWIWWSASIFADLFAHHGFGCFCCFVLWFLPCSCASVSCLSIVVGSKKCWCFIFHLTLKGWQMAHSNSLKCADRMCSTGIGDSVISAYQCHGKKKTQPSSNMAAKSLHPMELWTGSSSTNRGFSIAIIAGEYHCHSLGKMPTMTCQNISSLRNEPVARPIYHFAHYKYLAPASVGGIPSKKTAHPHCRKSVYIYK